MRGAHWPCGSGTACGRAAGAAGERQSVPYPGRGRWTGAVVSPAPAAARNPAAILPRPRPRRTAGGAPARLGVAARSRAAGRCGSPRRARRRGCCRRPAGRGAYRSPVCPGRSARADGSGAAVAGRRVARQLPPPPAAGAPATGLAGFRGMRGNAGENRNRSAQGQQRNALPARRLSRQPGHAARRQRQRHRRPATAAAAAGGRPWRAARRRPQPAFLAASATWRIRAGPAGADRPADPAGRWQAAAGHVQRHPAGALPGRPEPGAGRPDDPGGALLSRGALRGGSRRQDLRRGGLSGRGVPRRSAL
ncbi:hypothetical protein D9M71_412590 [compost metagenome]